MRKQSQQRMYDLLGVGIGPFNLGLAALLRPVPEIDALFLEQKSRFDWHPGLLMEETTLQVPFLADLVTMADPTNPFSFLNYLHAQGRLYHFYYLERFHVPRREYNHYCQWVSERLESCRFGERVTAIHWTGVGGERCFKVRAQSTESGETHEYWARNLVLGVGSVPYLPGCFRKLPAEDIFHSAEFLSHRDRCRRADSITVVGSGQSAAEVFYDLLKEQEQYGYRLHWLTRSKGFFPMEYSKLGLEHFSPDYIRYFHRLPEKQRERVLARQDLLYKGISMKTIAKIYDLLYECSIGGRSVEVQLLALTEVEEIQCINKEDRYYYRLVCKQHEEDCHFSHTSECVVAATGYHYPVPECLAGLHSLIRWDSSGHYQVDLNYRLALAEECPNQIFVQNAEIRSHGVGAPDLGLGAHRSAVIINTLAGRSVYPVRERNVFQQFGVA